MQRYLIISGQRHQLGLRSKIILMDQEYLQKLEDRISELEMSVRELKRLVYYRIPVNATGVGPSEQLLTVNDVVALIGLPSHIIYVNAKAGDLPSFRVGRRYKFSREKVLEWFEGKFDKAADVDEFVDKYLQKNLLNG